MKELDSTYIITLHKYEGLSVEQDWADWATELIESGTVTDNLCELASNLERP